jgi:hypothetical protein
MMSVDRMIKEIEIIIDGEKKIINIPLSWDELTLEHYMKLSRVNKMNFEIDFERDMEVIGAFLGLERNDMELVDIDTFNEIVEDLKFLTEEPKDLDSKGLKDYIEIDGEKWWIKKDFEKMTLGEKVSVDTLVKQNGGDYEGIMDKILTLFLKKKLDNGELETFRTWHLERAEIFKRARFLDIRNVVVFFSDGRNGSKSNMKEFLEKKKKTAVRKKKD